MVVSTEYTLYTNKGVGRKAATESQSRINPYASESQTTLTDFMPADNPSNPSKGDEYRYPDGIIEVVFAVEDGSVLTVKNYRETESFRNAVGEGTYLGTHEGVADLPGAEAFRANGESETGSRTTNGDETDADQPGSDDDGG